MPSVRPAPRMRTRALSATALAALFLGGPMANSAQAIATVPPLGTAAAFSVLAGATVTNTGPTTIDRSVGIAPGTAITGASTITISGDGTYHQADGVADQAKTDLTAAYNNAAGQVDTPPRSIGVELGGQTLTEGVYQGVGALALTGQLTLDGDADAVWVFQTPSTLITASDSSIVFTGGANACNVFWQVGSSATLGTDTSFAGTIMALTSISMNTRASLNGRALARNGEVTLDTNVITSEGCDEDVVVEDGTDTPTGTPTTGPTPTDGPTATPTDGPTGGPGGGGGAGDDDDNGGPGGGGGAGDDDNNGGNNNGGNNNGDGTGNGGPGGGGGAGDDGVQVTEIPEGAVDTGQTGQATGPSRAVLTGSALAAGAAALTLVAVRRRRSM